MPQEVDSLLKRYPAPAPLDPDSPEAFMAAQSQKQPEAIDPDSPEAFMAAQSQKHDGTPEFAPPADEGRLGRMKRLALQAWKESEDPGGLTHSPTMQLGRGIVESAAQGASGLAGSVVGGLRGLIARDPSLVEPTQRAMTYEPRSAAGKLISELSATPMTLASEYLGEGAGKVGALVGPKTEAAFRTIGESAVPIAATLAGGRAALKSDVASGKTPLIQAQGESPVAGFAKGSVGAAELEQSKLRRARAQELDTPIDLTKAQAERTFEQQRFERETAKMPEGVPLRERFADQNEKILRNFDQWVDSTGATHPQNLRAVGEIVDKALVDKANRAKTRIKEAYAKAEESGHMKDPVNLQTLVDHLNATKGEQATAPLLSTIRNTVKDLGIAKEDNGRLVLNTGGSDSLMNRSGVPAADIKTAETLRQSINRNVNQDATNIRQAAIVKRLIDDATENQGGDLYRSARRQRELFAREFEDRGVVAKLMRAKPGTQDRAVAFEDVFNHSILGGSLDDVRHMRRVLQTAGEEGSQAWKELQGATIQHIKDVATKSVARDERGNPIVSPAALDKLVTNLDKDGKLDFVFGKKGAEKIRTVNDIAKDVYTAPPGSVNSSNTATVLAGLLDTAVSGVSGIPLPVASAANYGIKKMKSRSTSKKVQEALSNPDEPPVPAFRMDGKPNLRMTESGYTDAELNQTPLRGSK